VPTSQELREEKQMQKNWAFQKGKGKPPEESVEVERLYEKNLKTIANGSCAAERADDADVERMRKRKKTRRPNL